MRITVGGVLFMAGAGAFAALGPYRLGGISTPDVSFVSDQVQSAKQSVQSLTNLFRKGEGLPLEPVKSEPVPVEAAPAEPAVAPVTQEPISAAAPAPAPAAAAAAAAPVVEAPAAVPAPVPVVVPAAPAKVLTRAERVAAAMKAARPKKRPITRQGNVLNNARPAPVKQPVSAVATQAAPAKAAASAGSPDKLVGSYVSMKLKTGREVKGILEAKTPTQYTLQIPGMGPFQYPIENVLSVSPAE